MHAHAQTKLDRPLHLKKTKQGQPKHRNKTEWVRNAMMEPPIRFCYYVTYQIDKGHNTAQCDDPIFSRFRFLGRSALSVCRAIELLMLPLNVYCASGKSLQEKYHHPPIHPSPSTRHQNSLLFLTAEKIFYGARIVLHHLAWMSHDS